MKERGGSFSPSTSTPQRAWLGCSEVLLDHGPPLRAFKKEGTGWKLLLRRLSGPEQMKRFHPLGSPRREEHWGRGKDGSIGALCLSPPHWP